MIFGLHATSIKKGEPIMNTFKNRLLACFLTTFLGFMLVTTLLCHTCSAYVYWGNYGGNTIGRANLDGSSPNQNWITGCNGPAGVVVDANYVYWGNYGGNTIGRANLDGSSPNQNWITGSSKPVEVAVDANYVYWAKAIGTIGRANLDGSSPNQSWITGCNYPYGVTVDANYVYWANYKGNTIGQANLDGTSPNQNWITGCNGPGGVVVDANYVYWGNYDGNTIGRANLDGSSPNQNWITGCNYPYGVAVTYIPAPTITSFTPTSGSTGTTVTITGTNFTGTEVKFGGRDAASFTVDSANQITAVVGTGSTGKVTVTTDGGTATSASTFTYNSSPATLATGTPSSYKVTVTKVEMYNGTSWVTIFSGTALLDMAAGGTFPGISDLSLPAGTYSQVRVTFNNSFPVAGALSYGGAAYYTTATTFGGQTNLASTPTTVAGSMAAFTFYNPAWGALNADVVETYSITPITVGPATGYQPTLRFTISDTLLFKGTAGTASTYYFTLGAPTVSIVEP